MGSAARSGGGAEHHPRLLGEEQLALAWYDNEWGFSNRMIELSQRVAGRL